VLSGGPKIKISDTGDIYWEWPVKRPDDDKSEPQGKLRADKS
jgi:hypothetical protein